MSAIGELPGERYGHSAVVDSEGDDGEGFLYVFGGSNSISNHFFSNELFSFRFRTRCWAVVSPKVSGGENDVQQGRPSMSVAPAAPKEEPVWPQGRHFHSAVVHHHRMIICGGKSNGYMNDVLAFDFRKL